jgi:general nucleoside transport system permease protein
VVIKVHPASRWLATTGRALGHVRRPSFLAVIAGFALSFTVGSLIIASIGVNPVEGLRVALEGSVGTRRGIANSLVFATPRLLVALGACVAIRSGVFNLGGEGQLQMGAVGAAVAGVLLGPMLAPAHVLIAVSAAAIAGGVWAGIAALLQVWRGANVLITTLLMNFVAIFFVQYLVQGPFQEANSIFSQTARIADSARLPTILTGTRLHLGFLIAILAVIATTLLLFRTTLGTELRAAGFNPLASRYAGLSPGRLIVKSMFISGALGGIAGATEILGVQFRLLQGFSLNVGFTGLAIAFLGALNPILILLVALLFGAMQAGVLELQKQLGVPASMAWIMEGLPILVLAATRGLSLSRLGGGIARG